MDSKIPSNKPAPKTERRPTTPSGSHPASPTSRINPAHLTSADIMRLQSTIGNHAVQRLLNKNSQAGVQFTPLRTGGVLQRAVMSFEEFTEAVNNIGKTDPDVGIELFSGAKLAETMQGERQKQRAEDQSPAGIAKREARAKRNSTEIANVDQLELNNMTVNVLDVYKKYQAFKNLTGSAATEADQNAIAGIYRTESDEKYALNYMIDLHHHFKLWLTVNQNRSWAKNLVGLVDKVTDSIEKEIQKHTKRSQGTSSSVSDEDKADDKGKGKEKNKGKGSWFGKGKEKIKGKDKTEETVVLTAQKMPTLAEMAGVSAEWYNANINGNIGRTMAFSTFCGALVNDSSNLKSAELAYDTLKDIPGMVFIRSLLLSSLDENARKRAKLEGIVGTKTIPDADGSTVTPEEIEAILYYTTETGVTAINTQLRTHKLADTAAAPAGPPARPTTSAPTSRSRDLMMTARFAVSGLNKMPKVTGIVWRVLLNTPDGYLSTLSPGAMVADLGFVSGSPSVQGTKFYKEGASGQMRAVFFMVHSKTAVNISGLAAQPKEGEVLFRPGTRFQVRAVWKHVNGTVPRNAPAQVQMLLHREGEEKTILNDAGGLSKERVQVIEVVEV